MSWSLERLRAGRAGLARAQGEHSWRCCRLAPGTAGRSLCLSTPSRAAPLPVLSAGIAGSVQELEAPYKVLAAGWEQPGRLGGGSARTSGGSGTGDRLGDRLPGAAGIVLGAGGVAAGPPHCSGEKRQELGLCV